MANHSEIQSTILDKFWLVVTMYEPQHWDIEIYTLDEGQEDLSFGFETQIETETKMLFYR